MGVDAVFVVPLEINPALPQELDGVVGEDVLVNVEFAKVELPDAARAGFVAARGKVAVLVGESEAQLDEFEHVDVVL